MTLIKPATHVDIVSEIYDAVDTMIAELSKQLHQSQVDHYQELEGKLHGVRRESVEAETIDQSITKFIDLINQAYSQSFNKP